MVDDAERDALDAYSRVVSGVAARLLPSVASLTITGERRGRTGVVGTGSAVVFTNDGFLLTNAHVVGRATRGTASFSDGREAGFTVIGRDRLSDLAVIRADGATPEPAELGSADTLAVGQLVVAVGSPLGLSGSVTAGVVSGLGRSMPAQSGRAVRIIEDVIQTDAALNPGNSGGALADSTARVVGINTAVAGVGLGLAVPINDTTQRIVSALLREGRVRRAFLGVATSPAPVPPELAGRIGRSRGVRIVHVESASPAEAAGLRVGDLIVTVGGEPVDDAQSLQRRMFADAIGEPLAIITYRNGAMVDVIARPVELTDG
ncbi:PDZ domain-containing protein [Phytoactinopolyspora alkaliphila]|uniref:PDZ domain-containing protein n=1 Tax=Phytoactinopolyspora alkaliphila TaxID=1783498 RepID=A0A6N9YR50_9ACTN|nr:trypsin-like peptidase domain-containing protein [Phytoactinopolyspora alkaliphila]NED97279.1 PDZ domain-containing protein [Phytoactinopolyspora alkaliphila]